jgi:hypothetical protein
VALVDPVEFERAKVEAAEYWRRRGDGAAAEAFLAMGLAACRFGMDARGRLAWERAGGIETGLRFDLESGRFVSSFVRRLPHGSLP